VVRATGKEAERHRFLARQVDGSVLGFFRRRMREEPGLLLFDELRGLVVEIADGFEGEPTGDIVGFVIGWGLQVGRPALGGVDELGKGFADVAVARTVVVEVVVELVGDGGELLEEVVCVLFATGFARVGEEILDGFVAGIEEFDEEENAVAGIIGDLSELLDFALGECGLGALSVEVRSRQEQKEGERESAEHRFLVFGS
jgi:hypothetical protein